MSAEVQPEDLQEETEERQLSEAQLPVLLLRRRQQRPLAVRLGWFGSVWVCLCEGC